MHHDDSHLPDRTSRDVLISALEEAGAQVRGSSVKCPFHEDRNASGSIFEKEGRFFFKCHSCDAKGDVWDVKSRVAGLNVGEWLKMQPKGHSGQFSPQSTPPPQSQPKKGRPLEELIASLARSAGGEVEATYRYSDSFVVIRIMLPPKEPGAKPSKAFRQLSCAADGWHASGTAAQPWPLYRLAELEGVESLYLCEGEAAADALWSIGVPATTTAAGAGKAGYSDLTPLAGKTVYCWPDNDEPGLAHMEDVAERLQRLHPPAFVSRIDPAKLGLPAKGDAVEFVAMAGEDREIWNLLHSAISRIDSLSDWDAHASSMRAGRNPSIALPWAEVDEACRPLRPGSVSLLCAPSGVGKSWAVLEVFLHALATGTMAALLEVEEDKPFHLDRILAQLDGDGRMADERWVGRNADQHEAAATKHRAAMDRASRGLWAFPETPSMKTALDFVEARAADGCRLIIVDPISQCTGREKPFEADPIFMAKTKAAVVASGAALLLVTHPRQQMPGAKPQAPTLDTIAGGQAYARGASCVLYMQAIPNGSTANVVGKGDVHAHKAITCLKSRNGQGGGRSWAFRFTAGCTFELVGEIAATTTTKQPTRW